jgi:hypothetical protein
MIRPTAIRAVDAMQVAALLEARGYNDRTARVEFGYGDVFELAAEVFRRLGGSVQTLPVRKSATDWGRSLRDTFHGVLYLLPSALFPAVIATIAPNQLVAALLAAGTLGWVWAGGSSWLAYQLRGLGDERTAGRVLACSSIAGLAAAAGFAVLVAEWTAGGLGVISLVLGVMIYQAASTLLVFYRSELWLATVMVPAAAAGIAYLVWGHVLLLWALGTAAVCVVIVYCLGVYRALRARPNAGPDTVAATTVSLRTVLHHHTGRLVAVLGYSALSAAYILHAQVPYLLHNVDVVLAGAPLIVTMGVVEWRARRVTELSRRLLGRLRGRRRRARRAGPPRLAHPGRYHHGRGAGGARRGIPDRLPVGGVRPLRMAVRLLGVGPRGARRYGPAHRRDDPAAGAQPARGRRDVPRQRGAPPDSSSLRTGNGHWPGSATQVTTAICPARLMGGTVNNACGDSGWRQGSSTAPLHDRPAQAVGAGR